MFLVLRNIVFDLIFLASMNFPVIQSCGTDSHNCSSSTSFEVFLLQNGINRAEIDFEQPDTGATYMWTLRPFDDPDNPQPVNLTSLQYNSSGDIFALKPTVDNQGLYSCRTTTNQPQQCPREYCVRLMSSPVITMFSATYFVEANLTIFSLEVTHNNNANVTTCLPVNVLSFESNDISVTCFSERFSNCFSSGNNAREFSNNHESIGSGFNYNLTVSPPYTASDVFNLSVTVRTSVTASSPGTSTRLIISTQVFSTSATLTVISPATPTTIEMISSTELMMSSSSSPSESVMLSSTMMPSPTISSSTVASSISTTTPEPSTRTIATQIIAIVVPSVIGVSLLVVIILVLIFLFILYLYPRISNKRGIYKPTDGDDGTINTNGVTDPAFELPSQGNSKEGEI